MGSKGEKEPPASPESREARLPSRTVPGFVMLVQGLLGGGGLLTCGLTLPVQRYAVGTLASMLEIAFAVAILVTKVDARKEAIRTFAVRFVMVVAVVSLATSLSGGGSDVTGMHLVWSFALLGVLLGEPTVPRVTLCVAVLALFDVVFFVGIARHAFVR